MSGVPPRHGTGWEDDGMASLTCDGKDTGYVLDPQTHDQPETCPKCGAKVRLKWVVRVIEEPAGGHHV